MFGLARFKNEEYTLHLACVFGLASFKNEEHIIVFRVCLGSHALRTKNTHTPNANMADHSVVARDELHESEVSQSLMFYFDNASPEKSYFIVDLFCFISLCLRVAVFLNATRKDRNLPPFTSKGK